MIYPITLDLDHAIEHDHDGVQYACTCVWPAATPSPDSSEWVTDGQDSDDDWDEEDSVTVKPSFWNDETVAGSGSFTPMASPMLATPRLQTVELLAEPSAEETKAKGPASLSMAVESSEVFESLRQWLKATAAEQTGDVELGVVAPSSTPSAGLPRISAENEALSAKDLHAELSAIHAEAIAAPVTNLYVDSHHLGFDAIPFPTVDFDNALATHPSFKVRTVGPPTGSGRSGFCNSFQEIARGDALRSGTVGGQ